VPKEKQQHLDFKEDSWTLKDTDSLLWLFLRGALIDQIGYMLDRSHAGIRDQILRVLSGDVEFTDYTLSGIYGFDKQRNWTKREDDILRRMVALKRDAVACSKILLRNPQSIRTHWKEIK
jgi:hypothetical protein